MSRFVVSKGLPKGTTAGRTTFAVVWLGQVVSLIGSGLTSFALGVWTYQSTGSVTRFALIGLCAVLPRIVLSPLAGTIVDRWDRRRAMIASDIGAGLTTMTVVALLLAGRLEVWHIYLLTTISAAFGTVQWPAFTAVTSLLVPKEDFGRANGVVQFGQAASEILSPVLAGFLVPMIRLEGVVLIDVVTFVFAVGTLAVVRFPRPKVASEGARGTDSLWRELTFGWTYIVARKGLLGLLIFLAVANFLWGMVGALITPMILSWTSSGILGILLSVAGVGLLAGGLVMTLWGGPRRRVHGVLYGELLSGICFVLIGSSPSFWPVAAGVFGAHSTIAVIYGSNQAIWQSKVAAGVQGRVFATQQMVTRAAAPLSYLLAGPLADGLFEPLLAVDGPLAQSAGQFLGTGPGRGIGLLFVLMGLIKIGITLLGWLNAQIRCVEDELPDGILVPEAANQAHP